MVEQSLAREKVSSSVARYVRTEAEKDIQHRVGDTPEVRLPILVSVRQEPVQRFSFSKPAIVISFTPNPFLRVHPFISSTTFVLNKQRFPHFIDTFQINK
jgi:hypothetical protein